MRSYWNEAFEPHFEYGESRRVRQLVAQVIDIRNTYEGHPVGDYRYADEALVDIRRLLEAFSAVEGVQQVSALKQEPGAVDAERFVLLNRRRRRTLARRQRRRQAQGRHIVQQEQK